ncbi:MAG: glycosyltransferase family 39 protein [Thaumarchaeota archaeon]|nr:glycosyltransferase family 39 protein [Nitrososphaerota archaeon]
MRIGGRPGSTRFTWSSIRLLLATVFGDLFLLVGVLVAHAATGSSLLLFPAFLLTVSLVLLSLSSLIFGALHAYQVYPGARRPLAFVAILTLGTLLAHLYVIDAPQAGQSVTLSGSVGTALQDDHVTVNSTATGEQLTIRVEATGGSAIVAVDVSVDSVLLPPSGLSPAPSYALPLEPGQGVTGSWAVQGPVDMLAVSYEYLTCYDTSKMTYGCIMDESYYVPEAQGILVGQHCSTSLSNCHMEHPYLSAALIAGGMALFGEYNSFGWRILPVILGSFSIPLLFGVAWKVSGNRRLAYFAALLFAFDVMFFAQSSAALLDVPMAFFGILAFFTYTWRVGFWKFDRYVVTGIMLALAGLSKETAIFLALGLLTYHLLFGDGNRRQRYLSAVKMAVVLVAVFSVGLQTYDSLLASPAVPTFVDQLRYMLSYGSGLIAKQLACSPTTGYWCKFANNPGGAPILPTDWILYYNPVTYYATSVSVCPNSVGGVCQGGAYSFVGLAYYGVTNLIVTWALFIWAPIAVFLLWKRFRGLQPSLEEFGFSASPGARFSDELGTAALALTWFLWSYIPYIFLFAFGRVTYPFYIVPAIPSLALGAGFLLTREWFPRKLALVYLAMAFVFFFVYFPDKAFLPNFVRALLGR